jgi:hypothetical protein
MNDRSLIALAALCMLVILLLTGCETLRVGFTTDYGTFSYELPIRTLNDK